MQASAVLLEIMVHLAALLCMHVLFFVETLKRVCSATVGPKYTALEQQRQIVNGEQGGP